MGDKSPFPEDQFIPFQVNKKIMELADKNALEGLLKQEQKYQY